MVERAHQVLITGAAGMLGRAVVAAAPVPALGVDREQADLTDPIAVERLFATPWSGVLHCAGYTDVDGAEANPDAARAGNVEATRNVAGAAAAAGIPMLLVSTDYVFAGEAETPYLESAPTDPRGVYATTKRDAEEAAREAHPDGVRIVRTAWLYGAGGRNFPDTMIRLARDGAALRVVNDQRGSPTWTDALAPALWFVLLEAPAGIYHATCEGSATWYEFACATFEIAGIDASIEPCTTAEFPLPAPRPTSSVLDTTKLANFRGERLPNWQDALREYLS